MPARCDQADLIFALIHWPVLAARSNDFHHLEQRALVPVYADILDPALRIEVYNVELVEVSGASYVSRETYNRECNCAIGQEIVIKTRQVRAPTTEKLNGCLGLQKHCAIVLNGS